MTKISLPIVALVLFLSSCGISQADKAAVCNCEELYMKMKDLQGEYQISDNISSNEAEKKVQAQNKEAYDKCIKLHQNIGEDNYLKASQDCKAK